MAQHHTRLIDREEVAAATMSFLFEKPGGFEYRAGQFVSVELPNSEGTKGRAASHTFTLASAPYENHLMIATRMRDSDFKRKLKEMPAGAEVTLRGPNGSLTLPDGKETAAVFIAGGIGITPFRSMLRQASHEKRPGKLTLFYSNRRPEDAAFLAELQELTQKVKNFGIVSTMTAMEDSDENWDGETGHVDSAMLKRHIADLSEPTYYVAGPPDMVDAMQETLREAGIQGERIKAEQFSGY